MKYSILMAAILALFVALPSAMAACGDTITGIYEGDTVTLHMSPTGSYVYTWSGPDMPGLDKTTVGGEWSTDTITFEAPDVDTCTLYTFTGSMVIDPSILPTPGSCTADCVKIIQVCPRTCPPTEAHADVCITDYLPWTLTAPTYPAGSTYTWTITETTSGQPAWSNTVTGGPAHIFVVGNFNAPTNAVPKRCFTVSLVVTSPLGLHLLTCNTMGTICLVYDPNDISITP